MLPMVVDESGARIRFNINYGMNCSTKTPESIKTADDESISALYTSKNCQLRSQRMPLEEPTRMVKDPMDGSDYNTLENNNYSGKQTMRCIHGNKSDSVEGSTTNVYCGRKVAQNSLSEAMVEDMDEPCHDRNRVHSLLRISNINNRRGRRRGLFRNSCNTIKRILSSSTSLGYYVSIVMVLSLKVFIFANTLNTVMGAKTFYMHWNTSNSIFRIDNTDHIIDVNKGNLAFEYDQVHIICPVYEPGTFDNETEKLIIYNVSKAEYETCRITNANPRIIAVCDKPQKLMYFTLTFRPFTPQPGGLEFLPGHDYYFISTSSKDDLHRRIGGRCSTNNMKVVFKVCCGDQQQGSARPPAVVSNGDNSNNNNVDINRRVNGNGGVQKKPLTTMQPSPTGAKVWSMPSPAVPPVSNRPTLNQPILQNDFSPSQGNYSITTGNTHNWQTSSTSSATKKTVKTNDFYDKRPNEVVKYEDDMNLNEKSTTNEMVGGASNLSVIASRSWAAVVLVLMIANLMASIGSFD